MYISVLLNTVSKQLVSLHINMFSLLHWKIGAFDNPGVCR